MPDEKWLENYRRELDRSRRLLMLREAVSADGEPSREMELRQKLLNSRYLSERGSDIDTFIRGWVRCSILNIGKGAARKNKKLEKEISDILSDWQLETAESYGEAGLRVLEDEFYNMTLLYIAISKDDRKYSTTLLGLKHLGKDEVIGKLAADIYHVTSEIPEKIDLAERLAPLSRGAASAFEDACGRPLRS